MANFGRSDGGGVMGGTFRNFQAVFGARWKFLKILAFAGNANFLKTKIIKMNT